MSLSNISENFNFTRYLYEKEDVKISLLFSLLKKNEDEALFWAYELYYSGYIKELADLLVTIYYDFYCSLNYSFESYLHKKIKNILDEKRENDIIISTIISNLIIRPCNADVFFLRKISDLVSIDGYVELNKYKKSNNFEDIKKTVCELLEKKNYIILTKLILYEINTNHLYEVYEITTNHFTSKNIKINEKFTFNIEKTSKISRISLISRIIHMYTLVINKKIIGKKIYVHIEPEDIVIYETIDVDLSPKGDGKLCAILPAYKILSLVTIYNVDDHGYLNLFYLNRHKYDLENAYLSDWLFYASFSPLWKKRIETYGGTIDSENKKIIFNSDDNLENFYEKYGYEPDEQSVDIQNRTLGESDETKNWVEFYNEHKGVFDFDTNYFKNFNKINYI